MSHWERVSESGYVDDGSTRKCAFAPTIGPNKDGHTHEVKVKVKVWTFAIAPLT